jgi:hypothetical protein
MSINESDSRNIYPSHEPRGTATEWFWGGAGHRRGEEGLVSDCCGEHGVEPAYCGTERRRGGGEAVGGSGSRR